VIHKLIVVFMLLLVSMVSAQTNPVPRSLPYWEDFAYLPWYSTTYPAGFGGWMLGYPVTGQFYTSPATLDRNLYANRNASTTAAGVANYNGKIGFLNSNINDLSLVFAVNTQGFQNITLSYDFMTIRNPYDGTSNTRINEAIMQYRVGESGDFTNLDGTEYSNNTVQCVSSGYPYPRNPVSFSLQLPPECDDQPVVQLRTASRRVSGDGYDPSFAIDNISVTGEKLQPTPVELSSFTVGTNAQNKVLLSWITRSETGLRGFYILRAQEPVLDEACLISPLITAANSSEGQSYSFTDEELFQSGCYSYWLQSADLDGASSFHGPVHIEYSAEGSPSSPQIPDQTALLNIYPNPFNPSAFITYSLQEAGKVSFSIYNLRGQLLRRIEPGSEPAGTHQIVWDGKDQLGQSCSSGIYRIRMDTVQGSYTRRMVLAK
jgi:hypothetical protein